MVSFPLSCVVFNYIMVMLSCTIVPPTDSIPTPYALLPPRGYPFTH